MLTPVESITAGIGLGMWLCAVLAMFGPRGGDKT